MARKLQDCLFLICAILVTSWLFVFWKRILPVAVKMYLHPVCQSLKLTSTYNISTEIVSWKSLEKEIGNVQPGGRYLPKGCISTWKVAIIVPYRDRESHLKVFLRNMHRFLQYQQLEYGIFIIEMPQRVAFNRGLLMNVGFNETRKLQNYNCFIFHDVDLLPENINNIYQCNKHPKHMAAAIDTRNYKLLYKTTFGGVNAFTKEQFIRINGFPNVYFGWGREDDDLYYRVLNAKLGAQRLSPDIGRYKDLRHPHAYLGKENDILYRTKKHRFRSDGLSNLKYAKISYELRPLYTRILIGINDEIGQVKKQRNGS